MKTKRVRETDKRDSNFEILRLISMYMIVFIHANMYLGYFCNGKTWTFFNGVVNGICNIGVTCFVLISGYFGLKFSFRKLFKMESMMIMFSVIETVTLYIVMSTEMRGIVLLEQLVKTFLPFTTRKYWFYSSYICLFCLSGFINKFIDSLSKKEYQRLVGILTIFFSVLPTFFYFEIIPDNGKGFVQMCFIYILGRYINKYGIEIQKKKAVILFVVLWIINGISHEIPIQVGGIYHHWCKDNSITNIVMAVILFILIKEWEIQCVLINKISKYIFSIFALNNSLVMGIMYLILNCEKLHFSGVPGFFALSVLVAGIMMICLLIGIIREGIVGQIENRVIDVISNKIEQLELTL